MLKLYLAKIGKEDNLSLFDEQVKKSMILNNFMWGIWALTMLSDDQVKSETVFNYLFAETRAKMVRQ